MKNVQSLLGGVIISNNKNFAFWIESELSKLKEITFYKIFTKLIFVFLVDFFTRTKVVNFIFFQLLKICL